MKHFIQENEAIASSQHHVLERKKMPESGIYLPNFSAINQSYKEMGGNATISFMNVLANTSLKMMEEQQLQYDRMERNQAIAKTDEAFSKAEREYLANNPSGKGYTEFVTGTYTQLYQDAMDNASNSSVKNELQMFFENKKIKLTNNAFQAEQQMYSAFVLSDVEPKINSILNSAIKHPEQYDILQDQMTKYLEPLQGILPNKKYTELISERNKDLLYSVGLGQIDQNPRHGLKLLDGDAFKKLPREKYLHLYKYATSAIKDEERQAKREAIEAEHLQKIIRQQIVDQYRLSIARNEPNMESEIEKDLRISSHEKTNLLIDLERKKAKEERTNKINKKLDNVLFETKKDKKEKEKNVFFENMNTIVNDDAYQDISLNSLTPKDIEDYYNRYIQKRNELNAQETGGFAEPLSLAQKVDIAKKISKIYGGNIKPLKLDIANNIRNSKNAKDIIDACVAVYENEDLPAISGIDQDIYHFARLAVNLIKGSGNEQKLIEKRDTWFNINKDVLERNKALWAESEYGSSKIDVKTKALKNLYKKAGYTKNLGWTSTVFGSLEEQIIRAKVEPILKSVFMRSGSEAEAEVVAIDYMHSFIKNSDVNGKMEAMINPPTPENTGLRQATIKAQISSAKRIIKDYYRKEKNINLNSDDIKIEAVSVDKPIYNFYYIENGVKKYCVNRERADKPETRTVYWPGRNR